MRFRFIALVAVVSGCRDPGPIDISGTVFDFEQALASTIGGGSTRDAHDGALVAGVQVILAEDATLRSLPTGTDGRYLIPGAPSRTELHPIARRLEGYLATEDGLGVQYAESDVVDYPLPIMPRGRLLDVVAAGLGTTADQLQAQGFQLFAIYDQPFPRGTLQASALQISVVAGNRRTFVGWDEGAAAFVTADAPNTFGAAARWLGLVAVTESEVPVRLVIVDETIGPGHPKLFVQHPMLIAPERAQILLLHPVN